MRKNNVQQIQTVAAILGLTVLICGSVTFAGLQAADVTQQVRQLVDAGKYRDALKQIAQHLAAKPTRDAAAWPERYELLCLKGESLLNLGDRKLATTAFEQAARAAPEPRLAAAPRAMMLLIKRSTNNRYKSKGGPADGIDIIKPESRRVALAALYADMAAALQPTLDRATQGKSLAPMMDALPQVLDLAAVEYASAGSADESRKILTEFGGHARELMQSELHRAHQRIDSLQELANTIALTTDMLARRGLHTNERNELRDLAAYTQRIADTARKVRSEAIQLGLKPHDEWATILADAADAAAMAQAALDDAP